MSCNSLTPHPHPAVPISPQLTSTIIEQKRPRAVAVFAAKSGGFSLNSFLKKCETCGGKGAIECLGCKVLS
ncbi:unnamed protein product [Prunus armeniaca]|uniref:Uncharacterized protein n=1 Tax=Prunus armeniaca TaxID=36596 RepID=A0A6J5TUT1_PRUAR|nr:unnamed protein product [Prunus armeniaca]